MNVDAALTAQRAEVAEIAPFLSSGWRTHLTTGGGLAGRGYALPAIPYRQPAQPGGDSDAHERLRRFLDDRRIERAVLDPGTAPGLSGIANALMAGEIARATNDWLCERWLAADERLRGSILVGPRDGELAAAEILRAGADGRFAQVVLACPPCLLGDRSLFPLFGAAQEQSLPVTLTAGGAFAGSNPGPAPAGHPTTLFEYEIDSSFGAIPHLVSILAEGVFERFPGLRLVFDGFGIGWLPALLLRMDGAFARGAPPLPPRLGRRPSELVRERVRFTTRGIEALADPAALLELLAPIDGARLLLYASGYPEATGEELIGALPAALRAGVLGGHAGETLRLGSRPATIAIPTK